MQHANKVLHGVIIVIYNDVFGVAVFLAFSMHYQVVYRPSVHEHHGKKMKKKYVGSEITHFN